MATEVESLFREARTAAAELGATATVRFGGHEYVGIRGMPRNGREIGEPGQGYIEMRNMTVRLLASEIVGDVPGDGDVVDLKVGDGKWEPRTVAVHHVYGMPTVLLQMGAQYD